MSDQIAFERILAVLHNAMLDDSQWPTASGLIDEACNMKGNTLKVGEGPKDELRVNCIGLYYRGERRTDLERWYFDHFYAIDERVARVRQLPDSRLVQIKDLYTAEELKISPAFNEGLLRGHYQHGLNVRMDGLDGSHMTWSLGDPVFSKGWGSSQTTMITRLLPHIRQFVRVRQALVRAQALETTASALLENRRIGVIQLDRRGRILAANDRARHILRDGDGLSDQDGALRALSPDDQPRLDRLVAAALPADGSVAVSGSMPLRRSVGLLPLLVHVQPLAARNRTTGCGTSRRWPCLLSRDARTLLTPAWWPRFWA